MLVLTELRLPARPRVCRRADSDLLRLSQFTSRCIKLVLSHSLPATTATTVTPYIFNLHFYRCSLGKGLGFSGRCRGASVVVLGQLGGRGDCQCVLFRRAA